MPVRGEQKLRSARLLGHFPRPRLSRLQPSHRSISKAIFLGARILGIFLIATGFLSFLPGNGGIQIVRAAGDPVIAAAGDIACDPTNSNFNGGLGLNGSCHQKYTSDLLVNSGLAAVLNLGDNQYYCGGLQAYQQSYDLSWGRVKSITHPSVGNHEYLTSGGTGCDITNEGAAGYFNYFGAAAGTVGQGWYSFDVGAWHIIALNSNCGDAGGCGTSSPQYAWLQSDLAAHNNFCTLAFWHIPLFSSGGRASPNTQQFWNLLYNNNADLILNGHDHIYERFAPQNPSGVADSVSGIRQITVGSGGANHTSITTIVANSEVRNADTYGVLKLTLHSNGYDWQFVPESGKTFTDTGSGLCHGTNPSPTATASATALPTSTPTAGAQPTATSTATPTAASLPTATSASLPTATFTATPLPTSITGPTATNTPGPSPTPIIGQSVTFLPVADSYVNSASPTTNYGLNTALRADGSPDVHSYVRFTLTGLAGSTVTRARLLFYMNSGSSSYLQALGVADNTWGETTINYNNAPPLGAAIGNSGVATIATWVTIDVTSYITGNGTYNFGVITPGATALSIAARESGGNAPELILDLASSATPTSTATATSTPTATASSTPTATATSTATPTATATNTPSVPTDTATSTPTATNTATPTATATSTPPVPTDTATSTPTATNTATSTATATTSAPTSTNTPVDTATNTPTATATATLDPSTATPTLDPSTATPIASATSTATLAPSTATPPDTATSTPTLVPATSTPTGTPTPTQALPPTATSTATPTSTPLPTATPTATLALPPTATPTPLPTATPTNSASLTFVPQADSYVSSSSPTTNYGTATALRADGSPDVHSYVRFVVSGTSGHAIVRVRLLFFMNSPSGSGMRALAVADNTWVEKTITYSNAPALGATITSSGALANGAWVTLDVSPYVTADGTYSFGVITPGNQAIKFASREAGASAPQLLIDLGP